MNNEMIESLLIYKSEEDTLEKMIDYFHIMDTWMNILEDNKSVYEFFDRNHYNSIAIYGRGVLGRHLKKQLDKTRIEVAFWIERDKIISADREGEELIEEKKDFSIDAIVVTPTMEYKLIKEKLNYIFQDIPIISIEEVILSV